MANKFRRNDEISVANHVRGYAGKSGIVLGYNFLADNPVIVQLDGMSVARYFNENELNANDAEKGACKGR